MRRVGASVCLVSALWVLATMRPATAAGNRDGAAEVESGLVGAWEIYLPNASAVAHWVFEFRPDGTYTLHTPVSATRAPTACQPKASGRLRRRRTTMPIGERFA